MKSSIKPGSKKVPLKAPGLLLVCAVIFSTALAQTTTISSPDKTVSVTVELKSGLLGYRVSHHAVEVIRQSRLGIETSSGDLSSGLAWLSESPVSMVKDRYELVTGKQRLVTYQANKKVIRVAGKGQVLLDLVLQVSNDGVAFRYKISRPGKDSIRVLRELTNFTLDTSARGFLQPMQVAKTGFEQTNPAYEDNYRQDIPAGTPSPSGAGWVYPALFRSGSNWILLTEAALNRNYCATRLINEPGSATYTVGFPDPREVIAADGLLPLSKGTLLTPWRVIVIGGLSDVVSSTLGTDVAEPAIRMDRSFVHPGVASWSWIMSKDDSIVYSEQKRYIDFAADMHWKYCLVDANWDRQIGYDRMGELAAYAASKNVGLLAWYNSAGSWNTVKMTPKDRMLTHESRMQEFARIKKMGIRGVKIDFFGGDGRSVIAYYIDILEDAAKAGIMVNFHGATLPRGWSRTYPHLVTAEAVKGFEMVTFNQSDADREANHSTMLPFTRNVFDPMDFTSMNLYRIGSRVQRKTTSAFELATSVVFLSGIQHYAESPDGMSHVSPRVKDYLRQLPVQWDESRFLQGYPGKLVVLARRSGKKWYIAAMNGENENKTINIDLAAFKGKTAVLYNDGAEPLSFTVESLPISSSSSVRLKPSGGFVIVVE
ncbi:MAG: glycoside hydrolase family 97 protein [Chitinophagaceae bacterium]|nr:MAG: glycoside hydrolase family 97 protein [Chitinophagaceae bacterium]